MQTNINTELVHVSHGKPFTDSIVIATGINNGTFDNKKHRLTIALIRKHKARLEKFGRVLFQTAPLKTDGGIQDITFVELNEDQATRLIMLHKPTEIVLDFQDNLVLAFRKALNEIDRLRNDPDRKQAIRDKRDTARPMTDGLIFVRDMLGKKTGVNHFCNEHLFVNRALTGKWKPLDESTLDTYDLRLLKAIRERNTLLIQHYPVQKDRKELMDKFVAEYRAKHPRLKLVM